MGGGNVWGLSVLLSSAGSYYGYKQLANTENKTKDFYTLKKDSVSSVFDREAASIDSAKTAYFAQNSWKGKLKNNQATDEFNKLSNDFRAVKTAKTKALAALEGEEMKSIFSGNNKTEYNAVAGAVWVFAISAAKLFFCIFPFYFDFRRLKDAGLLPLPKRQKTAYTAKTGVYTETETETIEIETPKKMPAIGFKTQGEKPKGCINCGSEKKMVGKKKTAKFCGPDCKNEYHNHKK